MAKWCSVADIPRLRRQDVLDACDLLDALDEVAPRPATK